MLDARVRPLIDPVLSRVGAILFERGVSANQLSLLGLVAALFAVTAVALEAYGLGLVLTAASRALDGLDGAVARCSSPTDLGGYVDSICDYVFYAGIPLGFAVAAPAANALPAAALLASFVLTCASFLAFAALAAKRGLETAAQGRKSFFYSFGLMEGTETIAFFVAMLLWPDHFPVLGWTFAGLCVLTALQRSALAMATFR